MAELTTVDRVKDALGEVGGLDDGKLQIVVSGVSAAMTRWMGRDPTRHPIAIERHVLSADWPVIVLHDYPVREITSATEGTTTVTSSDYRVDPDTALERNARHRLVRLSGGEPVAWKRGTVTVAYEAGFDDPPSDLVEAATIQSVFEWTQWQPGRDRVGLASKAPPSGGGETDSFREHAWLPFVASVMRGHRRRF